MGACGCGDFQGDFKFQGPGDLVYVLQVYGGCEDCHTPAGVILYAMTPEDQVLWDVSHIPDLEIRDEGSCIPVLDPKRLCDGLMEYIKGSAEEGLAEGMRDFRLAVNETFNEWKKRSDSQSGCSGGDYELDKRLD